MPGSGRGSDLVDPIAEVAPYVIGELSGLGCAAIWAAVSTVMRSLSDKLSPVVVNGLRCAFAAATLALLILALGRQEVLASVPLAGAAAIVASGLLGQAIGDGLFIASMKLIGASRALPVSSTQPLLTLGLAILFLGERVTWMGFAGTLLVILGIYLLAFPYSPLTRTGDLLKTADRRGLLLSLAAAACWAVSTIVLRHALDSVDIMAANFLRMITASLCLLGLEAFLSRGRLPSGLSRRSLVMTGLAGCVSALSSLMYTTSVYYAGAAKASILSSTAPLFGLPLSLFFLHERITGRIVAGTLITVGGIWLVLGG